ncbi:MAG: hypothetical protein IKM65_07370 [Bacteroidaceae bacterium]|nr:hypothetical protein [Bacteroidaceae bacterium]
MSHRTPLQWIALVTINKAKKLLHRSNATIKEVAQRLNTPLSNSHSANISNYMQEYHPKSIAQSINKQARHTAASALFIRFLVYLD